MAYVYLIGSGIVAIFWFIFYALRADLRKKILLTSIIGGVSGVTEIFFVPVYWNPQFQVIKILDALFLDSFIFAFFLAGFSSVIYQVLFRKSIFTIKKIRLELLFIAPIIFLLHPLFPKISVMVFSFGSMFFGAFLFYITEKKFGKEILVNGLLTFIFFMIMYFIFWQTFLSLVVSYNYGNLSGINIVGIPIEELLFFFAVGSYFCMVYEILKKSSLKKHLGYFYE